jgi:hypothetical protein
MTAAIEDTKSVALDGGEIIELPIAQLTLSQAGEATVPIHATYLDEQVRRDLLQLASRSCLRCFPFNEVEAVAVCLEWLIMLFTGKLMKNIVNHIPLPPAVVQNASWIVTAENVRVRREVGSAGSKQRKRAASSNTTRGLDSTNASLLAASPVNVDSGRQSHGSDGDSDDSDQELGMIFDRSELKKLSSSIATRLAKTPGKGKKTDAK